MGSTQSSDIITNRVSVEVEDVFFGANYVVEEDTEWRERGVTYVSVEAKSMSPQTGKGTVNTNARDVDVHLRASLGGWNSSQCLQ